MGPLNHSPAHILSRILIAQGLADDPTPTVGTWPVFVGREPDKPDNCITVRNTTGRDQGFLQYNGRMIEFPGVQVRIRGTDENAAHSRARNVAVTLDEGVYNELVIIGGSVYLVQCVDRVGGVISLGKEPQSARHLFTVNFTMTLTLTNVSPDDVIVTQSGEYIVSQD